MKGDKTTTLALIAAAVILAIVGIKSFLDYKMAELERNSGTASELAQADPGSPSSSDATDDEAFQNSIDQLPRNVLPPIPQEILADNSSSEPAQAEEGLAESARLTELEMYRQKLEQIRSGGSSGPDSGSPPAVPGGSNSSLPPMPSLPTTSTPSMGSAVAATQPNPLETGPVPPPNFPSSPSSLGSPAPIVGPLGAAGGDIGETPLPPPVQTAAEIAAIEDQVRRQPALAKVVAYDPEWAILVINSGSESNIKPEMRLAVRRGVEILGFIKVTEVEQNQSIAELMSANKNSPTARKPQPGDDIIAFNLF